MPIERMERKEKNKPTPHRCECFKLLFPVPFKFQCLKAGLKVNASVIFTKIATFGRTILNRNF